MKVYELMEMLSMIPEDATVVCEYENYFGATFLPKKVRMEGNCVVLTEGKFESSFREGV
jgi:hypothetical protein